MNIYVSLVSALALTSALVAPPVSADVVTTPGAATTLASTPASAPAAASLLPSDAIAAFALSGDGTDRARLEVVDVEVLPFDRGLRASTLAKPATTYAIQLRAYTIDAVRTGDVIQIGFHARAAQAQAETGEATAEVVFERAGGDYAKSVEQLVAIGPTWERQDVTFRASHDLPAGEAQVTLRLGFNPQVVEVAGIEAINHGGEVDPRSLPGNVADYAGRAPDAAWRVDAAERIERHRKADLAVRVVDAAGDAVAGAAVTVNMKRHAFGFGTAVAAEAVVQQGSDGDKYREVLLRDFNKVVTENDLKWPQWENTATRPRTMQALQWLHDNGLPVRGHVLVWPGLGSSTNPVWTNLPDDVRGLKDDPASLRERVNDHITGIVTATGGRIDEWDVINETWSNYALLEVLGREAMVEWFEVARAAAGPDVKLYYNDYTMLSGGAKDPDRIDHYYDTVKFLIDNGASIDGLGEQAHFGQTVAPPERMLAILDRFASLGLPIQITEFDVNTTDESLQADYTRDFYTVAFSHASVEGIMMWGFWEGRHWMPAAAMYRRDWSERPAAAAYKDLVFKQWWTNEAGTTGGDGVFAARGFHGDYEVVVTHGDTLHRQDVTLGSDGQTLQITLK